MADDAVVPQGRLRRTLLLAVRTSRALSGQVLQWARLARADEHDKVAAQLAFHAHQAAQYAELLGGMKGALMKVGQLLSFVDAADLVPEPYRAVYRTALAQLQADAPPMPPETVAAVVAAELGAPPDRAFAWFSHLPMAAASIGQVHAAELPDGRAVAVKVQYPGVAEAVRADLKNADVLAHVFRMGSSMLGAFAPNVDARAVADEIRARVGEELDYRIEAANQQEFADIYRGHPTIHVPEVVPERSAGRVLTMDLVDGMRWPATVDQPQDLRNRWAEVIVRFVTGSLWRHRLFNADPHPGNYLFHEDGRVTFLDFGCVKRFTAEQVEDLKEGERLLLRGDGDRLVALYRRMGFLGDDAPPSDEVLEWYRPTLEPLLAEQPFTYTPAFAAAAVRRHLDPVGPGGAVLRRFDVPPDFVFLGRILVGLFSVLAGLDATGDWRALADELREADARDDS